MGKRGPQKKPTALKLLQGNPGKGALPEREPEPNGPIGDPPISLDPVSRAEWIRMVEVCPWLTAADRVNLYGACYWWSVLERAVTIDDPKSALAATNAYRQLSDRLGFSPAARASLGQTPGRRETVEDFAASRTTG